MSLIVVSTIHIHEVIGLYVGCVADAEVTVASGAAAVAVVGAVATVSAVAGSGVIYATTNDGVAVAAEVQALLQTGHAGVFGIVHHDQVIGVPCVGPGQVLPRALWQK